MKKRLCGVAMALCVLLTLIPPGAYASESDVYAILYEDGELVFQNGDTPKSGKAVVKTYPVDLTTEYHSTDSVPWRNELKSIRVVSFADIVRPRGTSLWFYRCSNLERIDNIGNLNTSNVSTMWGMFEGCGKLTALDASRFDTSNVENMSAMFKGCSKLTALDVSGFNTSKAIAMNSMFQDCSSLTTLDVSRFNTSYTWQMVGMFSGCSGLTMLDIASFDTSNVGYMDGMFTNCSNLKRIYASAKFRVSVNCYSLFSGCTSLVGGNGAKYNETNSDKNYARLDTPSTPGYFTEKGASAPVSATTYTVIFNANGGSVSQSSKSVTNGGTYGALPTPTRNG